MTLDANRPLDDLALARLLTLRLGRHAADNECPELVVIAAVLAGQGGPEELVTAGEHVRGCERCGLAVREWRGAQAQSEPSPRLAPRPSPWPWWRPLTLATAAALVGVVVTFAWQRPGRRGLGVDEDRFAVKGGGDAVYVAVQRGAERFRLRPGYGLEDGDRLGFFYSAARPGYLTLLAASGDGQVAVLFPREGAVSVSIATGDERPLPDGGIFRRRAACEWLVGVFSDRPLALDPLAAALRDAALAAGEGCNLAFVAVHARSVSVLR